jgi:hypothetical protein
MLDRLTGIVGYLTLRITDLTEYAVLAGTYLVNIPKAVGGKNAYAGFTAATGDLHHTVKILNWTMSSYGSARCGLRTRNKGTGFTGCGNSLRVTKGTASRPCRKCHMRYAASAAEVRFSKSSLFCRLQSS